MAIKTALKNKTINDVLIFHIIPNFTGYGNNGTPTVLFFFKWSSESLLINS
jgi:hypothetical protein